MGEHLNGIPTAQIVPEQIDMFHALIEKYQVKTFIELGTFVGGLTYEMILKHPEMNIHTFEIDGSCLHPTVRYYIGKPHVGIYAMDVFDPKTVKLISDIINKSDGTVLLFCDNGNKVKEFWLYYPLLRPGDLIQVHDYPVEATPEMVEEANKRLDLEPIDQEYYLENFTVCWRKTNPVIK